MQIFDASIISTIMKMIGAEFVIKIVQVKVGCSWMETFVWMQSKLHHLNSLGVVCRGSHKIPLYMSFILKNNDAMGFFIPKCAGFMPMASGKSKVVKRKHKS
eukprot:TRINITY_DN5861_c0_g2_i1.p1 TRINITY_DN5861_c0_g2~~TRINITY_DN5861_c0_g2_i1.p1  ORF type:complete len:102 (-),score=16.57 TRINITY_DN5861_c0_g2_i1:326-631(-)